MNTALIIVAETSQSDLLRELLGCKNAGTNLVEKGGRSALPLASLYGYTDVIEILLKAGGDPGLKDSNGNDAVLEAIHQDQHEARQLLFRNHYFGSRNLRGREAIHLASEKDLPEVVNFLINYGADPNSQDNDGLTPLHYAASKGLDVVVDVLMKQGAATAIADVSGKIPADFAVVQGFLNIAKSLGHNKDTLSMIEAPIWRLAGEGRLTQGDVKSRKTELADTEPITGNSVLHCAVLERQVDVLRLLLKDGWLDVNLRNRDGVTPLLIAADNNHLASVQTLLEHHANPNLADRFENTPLSFAIEEWPLDVVIALVGAGATVEEGEAAIQRLFFGAVGLGNLAGTETMLKLGADPLHRHEIGMTAQQIARKRGNQDLVQLLKNAELQSNDKLSLEDAKGDRTSGQSQMLTQELNEMFIGSDVPSANIDRSLFAAESGGPQALETGGVSAALSTDMPGVPTIDPSSQTSNRRRERALA